MTRCQIILPARLASTRLPEKLLQNVGGKTVLRHTYEAASRCLHADQILVAVDDHRVAKEVESFGGSWMMTSPECASGTDRIAEVAAKLPDVDVFVNVQADEPEIDPNLIDRVASLLIQDGEAEMATAGTPIRDFETLRDASCVKIVMNWNPGDDQETGDHQVAGKGRAVYFSRATVPFVREGITHDHLRAEPPLFWHHIGIYAYRRDFLEWFAKAPPSMLEKAERLEQLRAVEAGKKIVVARVASATSGIDTREDLDAFRLRVENV